MGYEPRITKPTAPVEIKLPLTTGGVTRQLIAPDAIDASKVADETLTSADIKDGTIDTVDIKPGAVTQSKLGPDVVVGTLGDNSVTTPRIVDAAVTGPKIAPGAVTDTKLGAGSVTSPKIAAANILNSHLAPAVITEDKIAEDAIIPAHLNVTEDPDDGDVYSYDEATGYFKPIVPPSGGDVYTLLDAPYQVYTDTSSNSINAGVDLTPAGVPVGAKAVIVRLEGEYQEMTVLDEYQAFNIQDVTGGYGTNLATVSLNENTWKHSKVQVHCIIKMLTPQTIFVVITRGAKQSTCRIHVIGWIV